MNKFKKVAVIMGGSSSEREISLLSGNQVLNALIRKGVNAIKFDPQEEPICNLSKHGFDAALIMLHGPKGEDGTIQGVLEYLQIPYTGSGVLGSSIAMDKLRTKIIWKHFNIPTPRWQSVTKQEFISHKFTLNIELPVVVKPSNEGSTVGLSKVYNIENLSQALSLAFEYDDSVLIEEIIIGGEYTATVFNDRVYPIIKIEAPNGEYDYNNKYFTDETKYICPADINPELLEQIHKYALDGYKAVAATGIARVDFMINQENKFFFLEINTIPGMTSHSLVPMSFNVVGTSFDDLCLEMLHDAKLYTK